MKRFLANTLALVSVLLCIVVLILWTRTYRPSQSPLLDIQGANSLQRYVASNSHGRLYLSADLWTWAVSVAPSAVETRWLELNDPPPSWLFAVSQRHDGVQFLGTEFKFHREATSAPGHYTYVAVILPHAYAALLLLILPAWCIRRELQRRRERIRNRGQLCPTCSYDLRAHQPNSELTTQNSELPPRCPECGTPIPKPVL